MSAFDPKRTSEVAICCDAKRGSHIHFLTYGRTLLFWFLSNPGAKGGNSSGTAAFHFLPDSGSACWILCHLRFHSLRLRADNNAPTAGSKRYSVPALYPWREYSVAGGLISYGPTFTEAYRQAGLYF